MSLLKLLTNPTYILRGEGIAEFALTTGIYATLQPSYNHTWKTFFSLLFLPDLFMVGYLKDNVLGAAIYNIGHSTITASAIVGYGLYSKKKEWITVGLIEFAHIFMDRASGYGLKLPTAFGHTHLGKFGKWANDSS